MKTTQKSTKNGVHRAIPTADDVMAAVIGRANGAVEFLGNKIDAIIVGDGGKSKFDDESRVAHLTNEVMKIGDALRKILAMQTRGLDKLTKTTVTAWLRRMDHGERVAFLREAARIDAEESVLA